MGVFTLFYQNSYNTFPALKEHSLFYVCLSFKACVILLLKRSFFQVLSSPKPIRSYKSYDGGSSHNIKLICEVVGRGVFASHCLKYVLKASKWVEWKSYDSGCAFENAH